VALVGSISHRLKVSFALLAMCRISGPDRLCPDGSGDRKGGCQSPLPSGYLRGRSGEECVKKRGSNPASLPGRPWAGVPWPNSGPPESLLIDLADLMSLKIHVSPMGHIDVNPNLICAVGVAFRDAKRHRGLACGRSASARACRHGDPGLRQTAA
jgi:hypothetical protein